MISPVFVYDSRERFHPRPVEAITHVNAEEVTANGLRHVPADPARLSKTGVRLDFSKGVKDPTSLPQVGYRRVVRSGPLWWHCSWVFYVMNPKRYPGGGDHEGDFECVLIGCKDEAGTEPVLVVVSRHNGGGALPIWDCELADGRPVVYVARDSHAHYYAPVRRGVIDECDGNGLVLGTDDPDVVAGRRCAPMEWRPFGPWASWPGRWGSSNGVGKSPRSPAHQGSRWAAPHVYWSECR